MKYLVSVNEDPKDNERFPWDSGELLRVKCRGGRIYSKKPIDIKTLVNQLELMLVFLKKHV